MPLISLIPSLPLLGRRNVLNRSRLRCMNSVAPPRTVARARTHILVARNRCLFSCFAAARAACVSTWLGELWHIPRNLLWAYSSLSAASVGLQNVQMQNIRSCCSNNSLVGYQEENAKALYRKLVQKLVLNLA